MSSPIPVAVIGAGVFGSNHLRVYSALAAEQPARARLAAVVDPSPQARTRASQLHNIPAFADIPALLASGIAVQAASVCTPTVHHASAALQLMGAGIDVLIEKPLAASLSEADALVHAADTLGRVLQAGHLERFNPAVTAAEPLLHRPMFFESHRLSVFTPRSLDVDVVLDLMIHDLDIVLRFADSPVREIRAVGLPVLSSRTDIANVRLEFESGAVANFTASRVSTERVRKLRLFQPHQYLSLDFARQDLLLIDVTEAAAYLRNLPAAGNADAAALAALSQSAADLPAHPSAGLSLRKVPTVPGEPLRLEVEDFLRAVQDRTPPRVPASQARSALALALQINHAIQQHAKQAGLLL